MGVVVVAAIIAGVIASPRCQNGGDDRPDPKVEAFERERVMRFAPPGGRLAFRGENEEITSGKPTRAMVMRVYAYDSAQSARAGRLAVVDVAEKDGWRVMAGQGPSSEAVFAEKTLPTGPATLTIVDDEDGAFKLQVRIEDGPCPPATCRG
jgi:hypothetical protein